MIDTAYIRGLPLKERIEANAFPVTECGCWIWMRKINPIGYGHICIDGKTVSAHRAAWMAFKGPIPDGLLVCHRCDTPSCVNPDHLFLGTYSDNAKDRESKGRGQDLSGQNNNNAKLTDEIVYAIRHSSLPRGELAKLYGIRRSTVWSIQVQKHVWPHIPWPKRGTAA